MASTFRGLLGEKLGMTQVFDENNRLVPVSVIDSELEVWDQYGNEGWPARYLWNGEQTLHSLRRAMRGADMVFHTAGFVGSTLNMLDRDFIAGRLKFDAATRHIQDIGTEHGCGPVGHRPAERTTRCSGHAGPAVRAPAR